MTPPEDAPSTALEQLGASRADYVAAAAKSALGLVPFAGSLLVEIAGAVIPNQRIDRLTKFAAELEQRLMGLEQEYVRDQVRDEQFTDLIEEALRQASRSLTDERREQIASLVANSLNSEAIAYAESKHLLRILGELNDVELIWLRFFADPAGGSDEEFRTRHQDVLAPARAYMGASQDEIDKGALQRSYKDHLADLGLLERRVEIDSKPAAFGTKLKTKGYDLTSLGRLLLREIGLIPQGARRPVR